MRAQRAPSFRAGSGQKTKETRLVFEVDIELTLNFALDLLPKL